MADINLINNIDTNALPIKIGHYSFLKKIGSGNFAVVKLAEHLPTKAKVTYCSVYISPNFIAL